MLFYLASKSAKSRPQKQLRIATNLMEIVMMIVVAASTQLLGQLSS